MRACTSTWAWISAGTGDYLGSLFCPGVLLSGEIFTNLLNLSSYLNLFSTDYPIHIGYTEAVGEDR